VPFEVPKSWMWLCVLDCCNAQETKLPQGEYFDYIDIDAIDNKKHEIREPKHLSTVTAPSRAAKGVQFGDTLFSMVRPYLENIAFVSNEYSHCIASTGFYVLKPNDRCLFPQFLFIFFTTKFAIDGLNSFMTGDNSPSIRKDHMDNFLVPIPPLAEQKRIVAAVEAQFELISQIETEQTELKTCADIAKSKILDLAMRGKLVPQNPTDEPASELLARVATSHKSHYEKLADLPVGWEVATLFDIASTITAKPYQILQSEIQDSGKYPVISQSASYIEGFSNNENKIISKHKPLIVFGDHTRNVKIVDFPFVVGADGVKIIEAKSIVNPQFLCFMIKNSVSQMRNLGYARHFGLLQKCEFFIPPLNEQTRIIAKINELFNQIELLNY
jgi:type I restriction enzyme S subunit